MAYSERKDWILAYLKENKSATVERLASNLYVSTATIRRDLTEMQKLGLIERSHGGALIVESSNEISILIRKTKNPREKEQAASRALSHVPEFQTVFIDNSSTCMALAERMDFRHKTVVTNGLHTALCIARHDNVTLIMPGGEIQCNTAAVLGSLTLNALKDFRFDLCLMSCAGLDDDGSYEVSLETMQAKKAVLAHSAKRVLIIDRTKIGVPAIYRTAELKDYDIIVTDAENGEIEHLVASGINILNK